MDVSVIIVNYNTKQLIRNCINSIINETKEIQYEIIVSDNGSTDGSLEMIRSEFPDVILQDNKNNLGFGAANNKGLKLAKGKYIFYLNSDTVILNNAIKIFFDYFENNNVESNIGALGCNLLDKDLKTNLSFGIFPTVKQYYKNIVRQFASEYIKPLISIFTRKKTFFNGFKEKYGDVDFITGADLFLKNDSNALFDERFFMYYEETDLQNRMKTLGLRRIIIEGPKILHYWGGSSETVNYFSYKKKTNIISDLSSLKYLKKNLTKGFQFNFIKFLYRFIWCIPNNLVYTKNYLRELSKI